MWIMEAFDTFAQPASITNGRFGGRPERLLSYVVVWPRELSAWISPRWLSRELWPVISLWVARIATG